MKSREPIYHIWQNYDLDLEDWIDGIKERLDECGVDYSEWDEHKFYEENEDKAKARKLVDELFVLLWKYSA